MEKFSKRGQIGNIQAIIITLVIAGVLLGAGFLIFGEFLGELNQEPFTVLNETTGFINVTGYALAGTATPGSSGFVISEARNGTDAAVITAANYTLSASGTLTNATSVAWPTVQLDYSYIGGEDAYRQLNNTTNAVQIVPNLLGLAVLIALVVIIISMVLIIPGMKGSGA